MCPHSLWDWKVLKSIQEYLTFKMGLERGVCQVEGVTERKDVEKGISDSCMDRGPGGWQEHGMPMELH